MSTRDIGGCFFRALPPHSRSPNGPSAILFFVASLDITLSVAITSCVCNRVLYRLVFVSFLLVESPFTDKSVNVYRVALRRRRQMSCVIWYFASQVWIIYYWKLSIVFCHSTTHAMLLKLNYVSLSYSPLPFPFLPLSSIQSLLSIRAPFPGTLKPEKSLSCQITIIIFHTRIVDFQP